MSVLQRSRTIPSVCFLVGLLCTLSGCAEQTSLGMPLPVDASTTDDSSSSKNGGSENPLVMQFVRLPAGQFLMGAPESDQEARPDERPQHSVTIAQSFDIGMHEVTVGQFRQFVAATGYKTRAETDGGGFAYDASIQRLAPRPESSWQATGFQQTDNHPVVNVCWHDAAAFCKWLTEKDGHIYRLPTETEWEYACRAGTTTPWSTGPDFDSVKGSGNICDTRLRAAYPFAKWTVGWSDGFAFTAPVGHFRPNPFGLYDMHGNVFEWCSDEWQQTDYAGQRIEDPDEQLEPDSRIVRGGSFLSLPTFTRSTDRVGLVSTMRNCIVGFRVVREVAIAVTPANEDGLP